MDRKEKSQGKEKKNEEPSVPVSIHPSIPPAPEKRTSASSPSTQQGKENAEGKAREVEDVQGQLLEELKEGEEKAKDAKQDVKEVVGLVHEIASEKEKNGQAKDLVSCPPAFSVRDIDSIVDKHLGDFSSEIQLLLQEQSIHYNFPQSPHSTSNTETTEHQHILPHNSISQFSQYVSFYNTCPPVQDYVHSLQNSINSMLTEFERWPSHNADISQNDADAALASSVSAFVAGIRAANATTDRDDEVSASSKITTADVSASVSQTAASWQPDAVTKQFPDPTNRNPPTSHATLPAPTSMSGSACDTAKLHPLNIKPPQSQWQPQQSHTLEINRTVAQHVGQSQDNSTIKTVHCTTGVEAGSTTAGSKCQVNLPGFSVVSKHLAEPSCSSEPVTSSASVSVPGTGTGPVPPATALSSLISQLQPEVFSSLVEIIKDVKRNSLQFYLHITEPEDPFYEDVKVTSWASEFISHL